MANETLSNSNTNLIEIRHIGVTAKIKSPLKHILPECSTAETDEATEPFRDNNTTLYSKFTPSDETETTCGLPSPSTEDSKLLYEMHAERTRIHRHASQRKSIRKPRNAFTRIEFKLHKTAKKKLRKPKPKYSTPNKATKPPKKTKSNKQKQKPNQKLRQQSIGNGTSQSEFTKQSNDKENSLVRRLRSALSQLFSMRSPSVAKQMNDPFSDLEQQIRTANERNAVFYPFERGCVEFMRVTDTPPDLITDQLAERANRYATRFWAEFFGVLNIGVALLIAFVLQSYRFMLFTLVNTLLVGLLRMTADYLIKPLLASLFNNFLQPFFLLIQNIFGSVRDALEPIADALNNFMKPFANLFGSLRLFTAPRTEQFVKQA